MPDDAGRFTRDPTSAFELTYRLILMGLAKLGENGCLRMVCLPIPPLPL